MWTRIVYLQTSHTCMLSTFNERKYRCEELSRHPPISAMCIMCFTAKLKLAPPPSEVVAGLRLELVAAGSPHTPYACGASGQCYAGTCPHTGQHRWCSRLCYRISVHFNTLMHHS